MSKDQVILKGLGISSYLTNLILRLTPSVTGPKILVAILDQPFPNTSIPVLNTLSNTIGAFVASRAEAGRYILTFGAGSLPINKLHIPCFSTWTGDMPTYIPLVNVSGVIVGYYTVYSNTTNSITIQFINPSGVKTDLWTLTAGTKIHLPKIEVYP